MENKMIGRRIENRRKELGFTLDDIAQEIGVAKSTIQRYEKGTIEKIKLPVIEAIARVISVNLAWLCGKSDIMEPENNQTLNYKLPANVQYLNPMGRVPLVGKIACGTPILAEQNIEEYIDLPHHIRADFALTCEGDSMINLGIQEGDVVYIRQQEEVENGQVAAVRVGDEEATLKRFYFDGEMLQLVPENSRYRPLVFTGDDINQVHVIGLAVAYTRVIE